VVDSDLEVARARLGQRVGNRWLLERVLGTGGMGAVYAARSPDGLVAAVKILHPEMGARREVRERFLREGKAADTIGHPGVVRMLGEGDGEEAFLAMELLEGETLRERVRRHGHLPVEEVLTFAEQVLDVLVVAHARGVVHRDLKPDNLFVTLDGRIKVLDFGLARLLDGVPGRQQTRTGVALGTLAYMAPEQALGRRGEIDGRVDVFALGATMFRVLSGRGVHEAESEAELLMAMASRPAPPLASLVPGIPAGVAAVVDLSLAFSRDARYPDARTMLADVRAIQGGGSPPYATARLASRDERTRPEQPAFVPPSQSLAAMTVPTSARTQPLAAYTEPTVPYGPGGIGPSSSAPTALGMPIDTVPLSARAPTSTRTEPMPAAVPAVNSLPAPMPLASAPPAAPWPSAATPPPKKSRGLLAVLVVLGTLGVASAGGLVAFFMLSPAASPAGSAAPASAPPAAARGEAVPPGATSEATHAAALQSAPSTAASPAHHAASSTPHPDQQAKSGAVNAPAAAPSAAAAPAAPATSASLVSPTPAPVAPPATAAAPAPAPAPPPSPGPAATPPPVAAAPAPAPPAAPPAPSSGPARFGKHSRGRPPSR